MNKTLVAMMVLMAVTVVLPTLAADDVTLPDGFKGFRGLLKGTLVSKTENSCVLKVEAVVQSFKLSKATKPEEIIGKDLTVQVKNEKFVNNMKGLAVGDKVELGAVNEDGNVVIAVEMLRKAEAVAPAVDEAAKLRARVAELEKEVAALKAENEALRKQLAEAKGTK